MTEHAPTGQIDQQFDPIALQLEQVVEQIGFNPDMATRAHDVGNWSANDLVAISTLLHSAVAPEAAPNPTDTPMKMHRRDGTVAHQFMEPEQRYSLYEHATNLVHKLAEQTPAGGEDAFLRRAGNVFALSVVLAHPFEDGNGRTSRTLAQLIRSGYDPTNSDSVNDLATISTERDKMPGDTRMYGFMPWAGVNQEPAELLDNVAALDIPIGDDAQYQNQKEMLISSPYIN